MVSKRIIGRNAKFSVQQADGSFAPISDPKPTFLPEGDIELTGTFTMDWVNYWKLAAYLEPPR